MPAQMHERRAIIQHAAPRDIAHDQGVIGTETADDRNPALEPGQGIDQDRQAAFKKFVPYSHEWILARRNATGESSQQAAIVGGQYGQSEPAGLLDEGESRPINGQCQAQ